MKTAKYAAGGSNDNPIKDYLQKRKDKKTAANKAALLGKSATPNPKLYDPRLDQPKPLNSFEKAPQDAKNTKKPGKVGQVISKIKSNLQEKKVERQSAKEYKKKIKKNSGLSPYTTGASFKEGGFLDKLKAKRAEKQAEKKREKEYAKNPKMTSFMTGGMVNTNAKVLADKTPGSKGTKVGLNKRVSKPKSKKC